MRLISIFALVSLGVAVSVPASAAPSANGWGPGPMAAGDWRNAGRPWMHRSYGHPGMYPSPYGPPRYGPAPHHRRGHGQRGFMRPNYPSGVQPPSTSGHGAGDIWAPDVGGPVYQGFQTPPPAAAEADTVSGTPPSGPVPAASPGPRPGGAAPASEAQTDTVPNTTALQTPSGPAAEAVAPPVQIPAVVEGGVPAPAAPSAPPLTEPSPIAPDQPPQPADETGQAAAAVTETEPAASPTPPPSAAESAATAAAGGAVEVPSGAATEVREGTAGGGGVAPPGTVTGQPPAADSGAPAAEAPAEQRRSLVQRWLSPKPGIR